MKRGINWPRPDIMLFAALAGLIILAGLLFYKLGSLMPGLSPTEVRAATAAVGWHGLWQDALYLPLKLVRSVVFFIYPNHGQLLTRVPNLPFGMMAVSAYAILVWFWHGSRTAVLATALFATAAWTLHVSRLASYDVMYFWAVPMLLLMYTLVKRRGDRALVWYSHLLLLILLLYIPGLVWLVGLYIVIQYNALKKVWLGFTTRRRKIISILIATLSLPLLLKSLFVSRQFIEWLGLPVNWNGPLQILKQLAGVPVHLFIRGPQYPDLWLGRAPILDVFTLVISLVGIYFYATHLEASRSRLLAGILLLGIVLVGLNGPVGLSLLVPVLYLAAAAGLAFLLHEWLKVFPLNPLARGVGVGLVSMAVVLSCVYNLRAYFVAWPHSKASQAVFRYRR